MRQEDSFSWDASAPLDVLAQQSERLYYSMDASALQQLPLAIEERCWDTLSENPRDSSAVTLLFNVLRHRTADVSTVSELAPLKRLLDATAVAYSPSGGKVGNALLQAPVVRAPLAAALTGQQLSENDLFANPLEIIESLFPADEADEEELALAGMLLAGFRGLLVEDMESAPMAVLFGVQEALRLFLGNEYEMGDGTIYWLQPRLGVFAMQWPVETREEICELLLAIAFTLVERAHFDTLLPVLGLAKECTDPTSDRFARCLYMEGQDYERVGHLDQAMTAYETALESKPEDPELRGVLQTVLSALRLELQGDLSEIDVDADAVAAYGYEPRFLAVMREIGSLHAGHEHVPKELLNEGIEIAKRTIATLRARNGDASQILHLYVLVLKFGMELEQQECGSVPFAAIVAEADEIADCAKVEEQLAYQSIRTAALQQDDRLSPLDALSRAAEKFSQTHYDSLSWDHILAKPSPEDEEQKKIP